MFVCGIPMLTYSLPRYGVDNTDDVGMINYERLNKSMQVGVWVGSDSDREVIESCLRL